MTPRNFVLPEIPIRNFKNSVQVQS